MRARLFASDKHRGQLRKYTHEPYICHPAEVADIVREVPHSQEMLAAAWLHDTIEDCGVSDAQIFNQFGSEVYFMVAKLTNTSRPEDGNRAKRKAKDLEWIQTGSPHAKTVKLADLISNTASIVTYDPKFAAVYLTEKRALLGVLTEGDPNLWTRADEICKRAGY
jgi:(p)ppGpp synthase/HD superfamily hydrolase